MPHTAQSTSATMERPKASPSTITYLLIPCIAVRFLGLIQVEIELYTHRQMLRMLTQKAEANTGLQSAVYEKTIDYSSDLLQRAPREVG